MINLTRIDGEEITVSADEIETLETAHDTRLTLRSGKRIMVRESRQEIIERVVAFRRRCAETPPIDKQSGN